MGLCARPGGPSGLRLLAAVVLGCAPLGAGQLRAQGTATRPEVTVWLMPNEPAASVDPKADINREVDQFNDELARRSVVVLNTRDDDLRQQLLRWNPDFAVPEWPIIKGQKAPCLALGDFAEKNGVAVRVLIVNWGQAFGELRKTLESKDERSRFHPDVAQIGSTWAAYFKEKDHLLPPAGAVAGDLVWRQYAGSGPLTLHYVYDIRLLFYWKKLPDEAATDKAFQLKGESWEAIVESLKEDIESKSPGPPRPPMALPTGAGPNVLHDYVPLVWAGGGNFLDEKAPRVDLTSDAALKVPMFLSRNALYADRRGAAHRLIAFPRMSHEEVLSPHFMRGRYRAVIEPVAFLGRWKKDFDLVKQSGLGKIPPQASFWDYCGVTLPPVPFKGGSDLMVIRGTGHPDTAFKLAEFLVSDEACKGRLSVLGQLPAQDRANGFGTKVLLNDLGAEGATRGEIEKSIISAVGAGREYPPFPRFASDLESPAVLDAMQKTWQQISKGESTTGSGDRLRAAAREAEQAVNLRINTWAQVRHFFVTYWLHLVAAALLAFTAILLLRFRAAQQRVAKVREKNRLLEQVRTVRGFAASALHLVDSAHNLRFKPAFHSSAVDDQLVKALMIRAGLRGWRRGRIDANWEAGQLDRIIWQAVLIAIDIIDDSRLYNDWEARGSPPVPSLLAEKGLLRTAQSPDVTSAPFEIKVDCPAGQLIQMPLMLEHLLVCLLTNALKASRVQSESPPDHFLPVQISYTRDSDTLVVRNGLAPGRPGPSPVLVDILNESPDIETFEKQTYRLLHEQPAPNWPGIGLVEAYCVATQCYAGIKVEASGGAVSVHIKGIGGTYL